MLIDKSPEATGAALLAGLALLIIAMAMIFAGCGEITPVDEANARGETGAGGQAGAPGTGGVMAQAGAGGAPSATGGATGADAGPAYVQPTYSCSASLLAPVLPDGGAPSDLGSNAFQNWGALCTQGGGECQAAVDAWSKAYPTSSRQIPGQCSADYGIAGPGFCTVIFPARSWDTSCAVIHADQVPPSWHCCNTLQKTAMLVPASCGCP